MATTTQSPAPFSRLSRLGLGLGLKSSSASPSRARGDEKQEVEDEWYIPYSGPYEPPREPFRRPRDRDSWGDPINGEEDDDSIALASIDLHKRYEVGSIGDDHWAGVADSSRINRGGYERDSSTTGHRDRAQSVWTSSTKVEPVRASVATRRSTVSSSARPPVPSYVNLDAAGGVGESPMPPAHPSILKDNNRVSLAGLFAFGGGRPPSERSAKKLLAKKFSRSGQNAPAMRTHRRSSSTGSNSLLGRKTGEPVEDDDYYTSYYFSTAKPYTAKAIEAAASPTPSARHPYAYVPPTSHDDDDPQPAPSPRLTSTRSVATRKPATANGTHFPLPQPFRVKQLKNSASTPNLHAGTVSAGNPPLARVKGLPKPLPTFQPNRWFSAETWCDALLFPRPRLKIKHDESGSGRIVSPPESPVQRGLIEGSVAVAEQGVTSRVLAHSRSLADLRQKRGDAVGAVKEQHNLPPPVNTDRTLRPKSWALDDLDLPTPVPSLARVLDDGEKLDTQRKQWQEQATHSFQNKLTRSISRARSKSLTQKRRRYEEPPPNSIDFLAARACLGNQLLTPVVTDQKFSDAQTSPSKTSYSLANSLAKTSSKSSKSDSRGHSRTDSWGRSALRTATCGLTGTDPAADADFDNKLENALKRDDTKVIRLADPALAVPASHTPLTSNSPTPSGSIADTRIGIALSTPPLVNNPLDVVAMRLPAHPYAQGGLYSYSTYMPTPTAEKEEAGAGISEFVVPHAQELLSRQNNTPSSSVLNHPYAQRMVLSRDSYGTDKFTVRRGRDESDVPPPAKMWAQMSPGVVREILPGELQHSPYMSENGDDVDLSSRNSQVIYDTVGVGEALAYAVRPMGSRDSGFGTSDDHTVVDLSPSYTTSFAVKRSYRQPVQYDTTRPLHLSLLDKKPADPHSAHTFASSPLLHQQEATPKVPHPLSSSRSYDILGPRTASTSPESLSPPHSPRSFGNPDDLDQFYDLFYKPGHASSHQRVPSEMSLASVGSRRQAGSGLTTLARQLSEELESMALARPSMTELPGSTSRRPTDSTLEFVFEETSPPESSTTGRTPPGHSTISPFQPSAARIPEDVESFRTSSPLEADEDETALFRVGIVESALTPPIVENDNRLSFTGQLSFPEAQRPARPEDPEVSTIISPQPRINSLQLPSANPTRSSYMTTNSSASRMSGLSDFPAPPTVERMSLHTSYFEEAHSLSEGNESRSATPPAIPTISPFDDADTDADDTVRQKFGGEEEIDELVAASHSHHA
ncbi:hypothetical protein DXG03_008862 [Asterophora parasitica]|uniref:Uncharacterized protein n=1 Tax=Asterophora parasitica TaxID=117018 RepID=A0A9P7G5E7_9AGAR|nr:hypothetical protein DXG03_008862 [Asterophora parasitica]